MTVENKNIEKNKYITVIPVLGDNYTYLYRYDEDKAFVVDPGELDCVNDELIEKALELTHIFITHHHFDHIGGVEELKREYDCEVIGGYGKGAGVDRLVKDKEVVEIGDIKVHAIATPGHTKTSMCYYAVDKDKNGAVFTGDTLFHGGCGKVFECYPETMWESLQKLILLPEDTMVCPGHDYTEEDYEFALTILESDRIVEESLEMYRTQGKLYRSTIGWEKISNIFLKAKDAEEFAELRKKKDVF